MLNKNSVVSSDYKKLKRIAHQYSDRGDYDIALKSITLLAEIMYNINEIYYDDEIEDLIEKISSKIVSSEKKDFVNEKHIIFYDGFGLDNRGLALIYLQALIQLDYKITYVTVKHKEGKIPTIEKIMQSSRKSSIYYISTESKVTGIHEFEQIVLKSDASKWIIYTTPYDMVGIPLSIAYKGRVSRYFINLTDHAYWIGKKAIDYCIEYRDYGISISVLKRKIELQKIKKLPYYPIILKENKFEGFPFDQKDKKIIFSGGALYKTFGANNEYYCIVNEILNNHGDVIFLYAGSGDGTELNKLIDKYPQRVYWVKERRDLYEVMKHSDLYLSTYPINGGLMTQYAVSANILPMTLVYDESAKGVLLDVESLKVEFDDSKEMLKEIDRLLTDELYMQSQKKKLEHQLVSADEFTTELGCLLSEQKTKYKVRVEEISTQELQATYLERLSKGNYYKLFGKKKMSFLLRYFPVNYIIGCILKVKERL